MNQDTGLPGVYPGMERALLLDRVAEFISSGQCKRVVFLTGAGMSVSAGIPDFRSPGGMCVKADW